MKFLSEADARILRRVVREVLSQQIGDTPFSQHNSNQASDIFIAKVPTNGIPALTIGTPDVPGSAVCNIYRITVDGTGTGGASMEAVSGLNKRVFNLSTTKINTRYCIVSKSKSGPWIAQDVGAAEDTGTGACLNEIDGYVLEDLPTASLATTGTSENQLAYLIGIDDYGCMVKVPWRRCP